MTRLQATVALLKATLDYFPWPETWTGELQRRATNAGPAPFRRVVCEECEGRGKTRSGWMCSTCKGRGRYDVDDYTLEIVDTSITSWGQLLARFVNCDGCGGTGRSSGWTDGGRHDEHGYFKPIPWDRDAPMCERCMGTGRVAAPFSGVLRIDPDTPGSTGSGDATLDALDRGNEKRGDLAIYRDHLLPALAELQRLDRYGHFLVEWVWVLGAASPESLPADRTVRLVNGTRAIEAVLPDRFEKTLPGEIRAQHEHREASLVRAKGKSADRFAQKARDEEIRRLHHRGASLAELARRFGLDKSRVSRITRGVV